MKNLHNSNKHQEFFDRFVKKIEVAVSIVSNFKCIFTGAWFRQMIVVFVFIEAVLENRNSVQIQNYFASVVSSFTLIWTTYFPRILATLALACFWDWSLLYTIYYIVLWVYTIVFYRNCLENGNPGLNLLQELLSTILHGKCFNVIF